MTFDQWLAWNEIDLSNMGQEELTQVHKDYLTDLFCSPTPNEDVEDFEYMLAYIFGVKPIMGGKQGC